MKKTPRIIIRVLVVCIAAIAFFGFRWHSYVTNTESPYDEVGIELNNMMPMPLRKWGCDQLKVTFKNAIPPYGCSTGENGREWL